MHENLTSNTMTCSGGHETPALGIGAKPVPSLALARATCKVATKQMLKILKDEGVYDERGSTRIYTADHSQTIESINKLMTSESFTSLSRLSHSLQGSMKSAQLSPAQCTELKQVVDEINGILCNAIGVREELIEHHSPGARAKFS